MAQDWVSTMPDISTNILQNAIDNRKNELSLRSNFSGTSFPDNPVIGQKCYREDTKVEWQYNGETWEETGSNSTVSKDVKLCYGDMSSLYDRLATSLNDDGTLKTNVTANISEWIITSLTPTYVSANSFTVTNNQTGVFTENRAIKGVLSDSVVYSFVASSTYDSGTDKTTVTLVDSVLTDGLSAVQYGVLQESVKAQVITSTATGLVTATNVQSALNQLANASYITNIATDGISSTNVQDAINELDVKKISIYQVIASLPVHYQENIKWESPTQTTLASPSNLSININNNGYSLSNQIIIDITSSANWDSVVIDYTIATNRAGKDFYIYACQPASGTIPVLILSANSTVPNGYTATNSRKIGGFHCLCADVGTITDHALTGYVAGDILPASVWDLAHRPISAPEGMVYDSGTDKWIDIYLASVQSGQLASVFNGVTADGVSSPAFHWYEGTEWMTRIKKDLLTQREFMSASAGSNQGTTIAGSADPNTTGAHKDTANRRMISNIGCEDMCGALWQWGAEAGGPNRVVLGGYWGYGANCGSRCSAWSCGPLALQAYYGLRGCAEPARNF